MVAPADIAKFAAARLTANNIVPLHYVEGPEYYSAQDVADAFSKALNKKVEVAEIPKEDWEGFMKEAGFSGAAAKSMANMTQTTLENLETPNDAYKGSTTLEDYIRDLAGNRS